MSGLLPTSSDIAIDAWGIVFSYLPPKDAMQGRLLSRQLKRLIDSPWYKEGLCGQFKVPQEDRKKVGRWSWADLGSALKFYETRAMGGMTSSCGYSGLEKPFLPSILEETFLATQQAYDSYVAASSSYARFVYFFSTSSAQRQLLAPLLRRVHLKVYQNQVEEDITSAPCYLKDGAFAVGAGNQLYVFRSKPGLKELELLGKYQTGGLICSSPCSLGDEIFAVGSRDDCIHVLRLTSDGLQPLGKYSTEGVISSSPCRLEEGKFVVGSGDGHIYLFQLKSDLKGFVFLEKYWIGGSIYSSPCHLGQGKFAVGSGDDGYVHVLQSRPGSKEITSLGKYKIGKDTIYSSPCPLGEDMFAIGSDTGFVYVLRPESQSETLYLVGQYQAGTYVESPPCHLGGKKFAVGSIGKIDGKVYVFCPDPNSKKLKVLGEYKIKGSVPSSPTYLGGGKFVVGSGEGQIYVFQYFPHSNSLGLVVKCNLGPLATLPACYLGNGKFAVGSLAESIYVFKLSWKAPPLPSRKTPILEKFAADTFYSLVRSAIYVSQLVIGLFNTN